MIPGREDLIMHVIALAHAGGAGQRNARNEPSARLRQAATPVMTGRRRLGDVLDLRRGAALAGSLGEHGASGSQIAVSCPSVNLSSTGSTRRAAAAVLPCWQ